MEWKEIPNSWLIAGLIIGMIVMRVFSIDSFTTAGLGMLIGYVTGKHVTESALDCEEIKKK